MKIKKLLSVILAVAMLLGLLPASVLALEGGPIQREYGDAVFTKISNPTAGPGEPDGINTNDTTGFAPNRLNSYAWAMASRGDYIYIGTNRTLFGSALNAVGKRLRKQYPNLAQSTLNALAAVISGGDMPAGLTEEQYIPQIIRFDVENGTTKVIYQPATQRGEDGTLYYVDKDTTIIPGADVTNETASFRSVIEFGGNLYFGSLGNSMLQLVRVDQEDNAEVVYQTTGLSSSLRACCVHDDGDGETLYFGGQDTAYPAWLAYRQANPDSTVLPLVIRYLDPATAGSSEEDWSGLVADFRDFGQYADAMVYRTGGGNVWDLCSYNGKLYLVLAYDRGWALFRGEKATGDPDANDFGWKWTEIVGDNGQYPLAMDEEIGTKNQELQELYNCMEYVATLNAAGLLESTATPFVYKDKMYLGTFDNATCIQTQTMTKLLAKLNCLLNARETGDTGPSLSQIYGPIYEVLSHPQRVWVMDESETITAVEGANELLDGTTNDYVWRFAELDGSLYAGTFDGATAYAPYLNLGAIRMRAALLGEQQAELQAQLEDSNVGRLLNRLDGLLDSGVARLSGEEDQLTDRAKAVAEKAKEVCLFLFDALQNGASVEKLLENVSALREQFPLSKEDLPADVAAKIDWLLQAVDVEGLQYWVKARALANRTKGGFDLLRSEDGENWEALVRDGLGDPYNYGARSLVAHKGELFVGTANPYFGAQLWKMTQTSLPPLPETVELTEGDILPGFLPSGAGVSDNPSVAWVDSQGSLRALKAGTAIVTRGGESCAVTVKPLIGDPSEAVGQLKLLARFNDSMKFYDGHCYLLFTSYKDDVTIKVDDLYAGYDISDWYYEDIAKDISYGSNHNKITTAEDYFTYHQGDYYKDGITLDRGEIVTIGMYRDFDLSVADAARGTLQNSSLWHSLSDAAKTDVVNVFFGFLGDGTLPSESTLVSLLRQIAGEGVDYTKLIDGVVDGGVCFNRELYNQKLEWDQYENVTYAVDITQAQLDALTAALGGNLNRFSLLKNSCVTVALRGWNAAVGTRDGQDTAYRLDPTGEGIYRLIDAPKTVKGEVMDKLPGYWLNNSQEVQEPDAGFQDDTGWVYVSAPKALGGEAPKADNRLRITVTPSNLAAKTKVYFIEDQQEQVLSLSEVNRLAAGTEFYVQSEKEDFLSEITLNGLSVMDPEHYDGEKGYLAVMPESHARLDILYDYENAAVRLLQPSPIQVTAGTVLNVEDYACFSVGSVQNDDVVWDSVFAVEGDALTVSPDGKTLTANKACTAAASVSVASDDSISAVWFVVEVVDSFDNMAQVTFHESDHYILSVEGGGTVPHSGYWVKKGSELTVVPTMTEPVVISQVTANGTLVAVGETISVDGDTDVQVECRQAEIRNLPDSLRLYETGETGSLLPVVAYTDSEEEVYDPSVTYQYDPSLITVDETGEITVTGEIPPEGTVVPVTVVAGSSGGRVTATVNVILRDFQADEIVGRLTLSARTFSKTERTPHGCITFTPYEDMDLEVSYNDYYEPTQDYHDLMTDYKEHPENYVSDPALYNPELTLEVPQSNAESYFTERHNGPKSAPAAIHLLAGESITVSNYGFDATDLLAVHKAVESGTIYWVSEDARKLVEQIERFTEGQEIDGPAAFDSLVNSLVMTYAITVATGHNPADGVSDGGQEINREAYNQFRESSTQIPNTYYTLEITRAHLSALRTYLADPDNNYYALFIKNCASGVVDLWNTTLFDRPDLKITSNYTGFTVDPESLHVELGLLWLKTGRTFDGTGEGGGINFVPHISPAWYRVTVTPDNLSKYEGQADPELTATVEGLPEGKTLNYTLTRAPGEAVGTYPITVELGENPGCWVTAEEGTFTIRKKEIIPDPETPSGGGSGGGSGGSGDSDSDSGAITVDVSGDRGSASVTAGISDNTAFMTAPTAAQWTRITGQTGETGSAVIDLSGLPATVTALSIPAQTVKALQDALEEGGSGLTVKLPGSTVTFDAQALDSIATQTAGSDLLLSVKPVGQTELNGKQRSAAADLDVQAVYDIYLTSGGKRITDFGGGKAVIQVNWAVKSGQRPGGMVVWYLAEEGTKTRVPTTATEKAVQWTVTHFSHYAISYDKTLPGACPKDQTCPMTAFPDLDKNAWYHDGVHWALETGVMQGTGGGFDPSGATSRAMIVTMLYRMEGEPASQYAMTFQDVAEGQWYTNAIRWAAEQKLVGGYDAQTFGPADPLTREQLAVILCRYSQYKGAAAQSARNLSGYRDAARISAWATEAFRWAVEQGIIIGTDSNSLSPQTETSRAMTATMLMRYSSLG